MSCRPIESPANQHLEKQDDPEAMWDAMAAQYNVSQKEQGMMDSQKVAEILHHKKRLMNGEVLDVGGGAGLYAIPFAHYAKKVTITDISANMLFYAKENANAAGLDNLEYTKLDWDKVNLKDLGWENHFDLVFASMCPAIREGESINKMINASKNWCCINRIIKMKDSAAEKIAVLLKISERFEPHNNRERIQSLFNYLWEKGFAPELDYYEETSERFYTVDEAASHYERRFYKIAEERKINLRDVIAAMAENNRLQVIRYKKHCLLSWQIMK